MADRTLRIITETSGNAKAGIDSLSSSADNLKKSTTGAGKGIEDLASSFGLSVSPAALATAGIAAVGAAVVTSVNAAREGRAVQAQLAAVLESTGHAAGISQEALNKHAEALQSVTNFDDEAVGSAQALLLTFTEIGGKTIPRATEAVLNMSTAMKQDLGSSSVMVGKALNDPIKGITSLTRVGVTFTEEQKNMIKSLVEVGDKAGAQAVILAELEKEFGGSAAAAREADGGFIALGNSLGNLSEAAGDLILGINEGTGAVGGLIEGVDNLTAVVTEAGEAIRSGPLGALEALTAVANPLTPIMAALGMDVFPSVTAASTEAAAAINTQADAHTNAAAAAGEQASATAALSLSQIETLSTLSQMEEDFNEKKQRLLDDRLTAESDAALSQADNYKAMNEKLKAIDDARGEQTAGQIAAKKEKVIAGYNEENIEIQAKLDERQKAIDDQIAKEKAQHEEKAAELKRLMALQTLEQSGQLEELTGIAGITAQQYMDAVAAGAISANKEVETQAAATEKTFEGAQRRTVDIVKQNQALIARLHGDTSASIVEDSHRTTSAIVSDSERQAAAYRATQASRQTVSYSSTQRNTNWGPGMASGGSFIVPPGHPNDSFPMRVSSGEQVTVIPASEAGRGPGFAKGTGSGVPRGWKLDETGSSWVPPEYDPGDVWNGNRWVAPAASTGFQRSFKDSGAASKGYLGADGKLITTTARERMAAEAGRSSSETFSSPVSAPSTGSIGGASRAGVGEGGIHIHLDYHPAVSLADQRELIQALKPAVAEILRLNKVATA